MAALAALTIVLTLGGCAMQAQTESRMTEYREEADALAAELVAAVPADLVAEPGSVASEPRYGEGTPEDDPSAAAWWRTRVAPRLVDEADASTRAREAVSELLEGKDWESADSREDGRRTVESFRPEGADESDWAVEVTWVTTEAGKAETFEVLVVSPVTVRGDGVEER